MNAHEFKLRAIYVKVAIYRAQSTYNKLLISDNESAIGKVFLLARTPKIEGTA